MTWSSYAHLPNGEKEYFAILSQIENGMSIQDVDNVIAKVKGKEKVQHHYRSNLVNLGLFDIAGGKVHLNYDVSKLKRNPKYLKIILSNCLNESNSKEIEAVKNVICKEKTYEMQVIVDCLREDCPEVEKSNLIRWMRPIVNTFKIIGLLSDKKSIRLLQIKKIIQEAYFNLTNEYGSAIALEELDRQLKKMDSSYNIVTFIEELCGSESKFKIELLMLPNWATHNRAYIINSEYYTHLKVKNNLLEETVS